MTNANSSTTSGITSTLAETPHDRDQVYRLRYACYRRKESIDVRADESFSDGYDTLPNHFSFLARSASGDPLATVRISVVRPDLGWSTAPSQKVFGDDPAFQAIAKGSFVEASRLCFGEQARRDVLMQVVSYLAAMADFYEVDWIVACPREEHSAIYERLFGFARLAEPRQYFGVKFRTSLLAVSREQLHSYTQGIRSMNTARINALDSLVEAASRTETAPSPKKDESQKSWNRGCSSAVYRVSSQSGPSVYLGNIAGMNVDRLGSWRSINGGMS